MTIFKEDGPADEGRCGILRGAGEVGRGQAHFRLGRDLKFWEWSVHDYVMKSADCLHYWLDALQTRSSIAQAGPGFDVYWGSLFSF